MRRRRKNTFKKMSPEGNSAPKGPKFAYDRKNRRFLPNPSQDSFFPDHFPRKIKGKMFLPGGRRPPNRYSDGHKNRPKSPILGDFGRFSPKKEKCPDENRKSIFNPPKMGHFGPFLAVQRPSKPLTNPKMGQIDHFGQKLDLVLTWSALPPHPRVSTAH